MLKVLFIFAIVSISYGNPVDKIGGNTSSIIQVSNILMHNNVSKINVAGEGGAIMSNLQSLPNENQAFLMTSPAGLSSSKVKARKGALLEESENISLEKSPLNSTDKAVNDNATLKNNSTKENTNSSQSILPSVTIPPKPLILSKELLNKADLLNSDPAPNEIDERKVKIHKTSTNGHPGMITPIIITVLVVPIFAMIGYMALKRGQEAWKNRHYKRMDFLLDGMYND